MDSPEKVMKKEAIFKNELFQEQLINPIFFFLQRRKVAGSCQMDQQNR